MGKLFANGRTMALPAAILLLVLVMVVPIPPALLDIFFVANIAISLAVLMVALNAEKPLDFSAFPTVLLFATLFRLGLNVASTRIVLVHGHEGESAAGHVIEAFGTFLIGGDYVVGLFVFGSGAQLRGGAPAAHALRDRGPRFRGTGAGSRAEQPVAIALERIGKALGIVAALNECARGEPASRRRR